MPLRYLFIDMNAFFASVEQQEKPEIRGKPVVVIPTNAKTTSCIAASYEAKTFGIKTGTPVWEAQKLCPGIVCVVANHKRYVVMHNRILDALTSVLHIDRVMSIDEMSCRLIGDERRQETAVARAYQIKQAIADRAGDCMRCSIGIGPNTMLAKMAADMRKPDGLVVLPDAELPAALHELKLQDFPGIGPRMERRLNLYGVFAVSQLCSMSEKALSEVWGSKILGSRWYRLLHGDDVADPPSRRQTVSHSHILPPDFRTDAGAYGILIHLTHKVAARLRRIQYWVGAVTIEIGFRDDEPVLRTGWHQSGWDARCRVPLCQDTPTILHAVAKLWNSRPAQRVPFKVGVVLSDLRPTKCATPSLFDEDRKAAEVSHAMDEANEEFGANAIHFGAMHGYESQAPSRIAFTQIPDLQDLS